MSDSISTTQRLRRIDWLVAARNTWLAVIVGLSIHAFCLPYSHSVYDVYQLAARRWLAGDDMYLPAREHYRYSPLFAVALTPLAVLPDGASAAGWKLINCGVLAWGLYAWSRRLCPKTLSANEAAAVLLLAFPLALHSLYNSQANLMMLGSLLLGLAAAAEAKWQRAALWLAWATLIKGYPLALAMVLTVLFPWQFAARYLLALSVGLLLPFAAQRPAVVVSQYASWWHHLRDSTEIMRERLRSVDQLFVVFGQPISERTFALFGLLAGVAVLVVCLSIVRRLSDRREILFRTFLWFSLWVVLFGPATEACTYVVAAPAVGWALVDAWHRRSWWLERALLVSSLLMMGPMVTDMFGKIIRNFSNEHGSQPIGALLLLVWLAVEWRRRIRSLHERDQDPRQSASMPVACLSRKAA